MEDYIEVDYVSNFVQAKYLPNLSLLDQVFASTLTAYLDNERSIQMEVKITYITKGPEFEEMAIKPVIRCSEFDTGFQFTLPRIVLSE